jgi:hypothetical protein
VASLVLHAILFVPGVRDLFSGVVTEAIDQRIAPEPVAPPMEFTLVSPPENPTPTEQESQYRSTVSSAASDQDPRDTGANVPHGSCFPIPDSRRPGRRRRERSCRRSRRSRAIERSAAALGPARQLGGFPFADETHDFDEPGSARPIGGIR